MHIIEDGTSGNRVWRSTSPKSVVISLKFLIMLLEIAAKRGTPSTVSPTNTLFGFLSELRTYICMHIQRTIIGGLALKTFELATCIQCSAYLVHEHCFVRRFRMIHRPSDLCLRFSNLFTDLCLGFSNLFTDLCLGFSTLA